MTIKIFIEPKTVNAPGSYHVKDRNRQKDAKNTDFNLNLASNKSRVDVMSANLVQNLIFDCIEVRNRVNKTTKISDFHLIFDNSAKIPKLLLSHIRDKMLDQVSTTWSWA